MNDQRSRVSQPTFFQKWLFCRRQVWVPTWRLGLILGVIILSAGSPCFYVYDWLALTRPVPARILVVEGWLPDPAIVMAVREFRRGQYEVLVTTGVDLERGHYLSEYRSYAEVSAASCRKFGVSAQQIVVLPAGAPKRERTYTCALAVREWLARQGKQGDPVNVITLGPHSRRSGWLFRLALSGGTPVGTIAVPNPDYDPGAWWRYSAGVKDVLMELIGYGYARFFFSPPSGASVVRIPSFSISS